MIFQWIRQKQHAIAVLAIIAIVLHLTLLFGGYRLLALPEDSAAIKFPLWIALIFGGMPLVWDLLKKLLSGEFGSDLLAGISIVTSILLGEYLAGTLVVLMLSGGEAIEAYAVRSASSVLEALANRMPNVAHRKINSQLTDVPLDQVEIGDTLIVFPHETCPVDGTVTEGHGVMDESYLTGEPYMMSKTPGTDVLSGAINGENALTIRADRRAEDSRYAKIMQVMQTSQQQRPRIRRLGDQLGAVYTPIAVAIGVAAWIIAGDPIRFLAVMVVATPCPLLIAIPVAIIGSVSLAAKRAIVIRDPSVLEQAPNCRSIIFDKTGTLTYGNPQLTNQSCSPQYDPPQVLSLVASLEQYSKHPLSEAILSAARATQLKLHAVNAISERPGEGLSGEVDGYQVQITSRNHVVAQYTQLAERLPPQSAGLECVVLIDGNYAATYSFRDAPRDDGAPFINHLTPKHHIERVILLSGDRQSEVQYLADMVGVKEVYAEKSPEEKLEIVQAETRKAKTIYVGDGINDAPALMAATVGVAFGQNSDVTTEAAGVVIMDTSLAKVDEFLHIGQRMRSIALQSAVGGMLLSITGMLFASAGYLPPVAGAITQEIIDVLAVLNALRVALLPESLTDF